MSEMESSSRQETSDGSPLPSPVPPPASPVLPQFELHYTHEQPGSQGFTIAIESEYGSASSDIPANEHLTSSQGVQFGSASSVLNGNPASVEEVLPVFNPPQHSDDVGIRVRRNTPLPAGGPLGRYPPYKPTGADLEAAKALEKQLEEVRKQEQALLRQGDAVLNALALNTQILIGFSATVKSIYPDNYHPGTSSCGKVVLTDSSISSVSFVLGYVLALVLAVHKLRKLARLAKHLKTRRKNVQRDSLDFLKDFMAQGIHPAPSSTSSMPNSPYDIAVARARADVDANTQSLESSFGKRIRSMIEDPSTVSKFGSDYTWGLIVFTFLAAVYGLGYPLISAYLRCRENV